MTDHPTDTHTHDHEHHALKGRELARTYLLKNAITRLATADMQELANDASTMAAKIAVGHLPTLNETTRKVLTEDLEELAVRIRRVRELRGTEHPARDTESLETSFLNFSIGCTRCKANSSETLTWRSPGPNRP